MNLNTAYAYTLAPTQIYTLDENDFRPQSKFNLDDGGWSNDVLPQVYLDNRIADAFSIKKAFGLSDYISNINTKNMHETLTEEDLKNGIAPTMPIDKANTTVSTYRLKPDAPNTTWTEGAKVGALGRFSYIGTYEGVPIRATFYIDGEYHKVWKNLDAPYVQVANNIIGGVALFNIKNVRISYYITPIVSDNECYYPLTYFGNSFLTVSALTYRSPYTPDNTNHALNVDLSTTPSDIAVIHHSVPKVECAHDTVLRSFDVKHTEWDAPTRNDNYDAICKGLYPIANKGNNNPQSPDFTKQSFTMYLKTTNLSVFFPYIEWMNVSSSHIARQATDAPVIKASKSMQIQTLDDIDFTLEQKVKSLGFSTFHRFNEMQLKFDIPREVQCKSIEVFQKDHDVSCIPLDKKAGILVHNKETNTITFTFNKDWLTKNMPLHGEKYIIHVKGRVISPSKKTRMLTADEAGNPYKLMELKASCKTYGDPVTSTKTLTRALNDKKSIPIETLEPAQYHEVIPTAKANHGALVGVSLSANPQAGSYIQPKNRVTYTLDVTNNASTSQNCAITLPLPKHMHYIETLQTVNPQVEQTRKGSTLGWNLTNLKPGSHTKLNFVAESDADCAVYGSKLFTQATYTFEPSIVKNGLTPKNFAQARSTATAPTPAQGADSTSHVRCTACMAATSAQGVNNNASAVYYSNPLIHTTKQNDQVAPCIDVTLTSNKQAGAALQADEEITYTVQVQDLMNANTQKEKSHVYVVVPLGTRLDNAEIVTSQNNAASTQKAFYDAVNHCIQWDISELLPGQTLSLSYKARTLRYPTSAPINQQALFTVHNALHNTNEIQYSNALLHNALSGSFLQNGVSASTQTDTPTPGVAAGTQTDTTITGDMKVPSVATGTQTDTPTPGVAAGTQTNPPTPGVSSGTQTDTSTGVSTETQTDSSSGVETSTQTNPSTGVSTDTQTDTPSGTTNTNGSGTNPQAGTPSGTSTPGSTSTPTGTHDTGSGAGGTSDSTNPQESQPHGKKPPHQREQTPSETMPHKNENGNNTGNSNESTNGNGTGQGTGNSSTSNAGGKNTSSTSTTNTSGTQGTTSGTNTTPGGSQNQGTTSQNDKNHPNTTNPETPDKIPNASKLLYPLAPENRWYVDFKAAAKLLSNYLDLRPETLAQVWHSLRNGKSDQSQPYLPNGTHAPGKQGEQNTLYPTIEQVLKHLTQASEKDIFSRLFPQHNAQTPSDSGHPSGNETSTGQKSDTSSPSGTGITSGTSTGTGAGTSTGTGTTGTGTNSGAGAGTDAGAESSTGTAAAEANGARTSASQSQNNTSINTNAQNGNTNGSATSGNANNPSLSHANISNNAASANQSHNAGNAANAANGVNGSTSNVNESVNNVKGNSKGINSTNGITNGAAGNASNTNALPTFALSSGNSLVEESAAQEEQRGGSEKHRSQRLSKAHNEKSKKFKGFNHDNGTKLAKNLLKHKLFPQTGSSVMPFVLLSLTLLLSGAFCFIYAARNTLQERYGYGYSQQEKEITIPRA
ncbi:hypothetical protein ACTQKJ_00495 [Eggerthellaceae bacterium PR-HUZ602407-17]